MRLPCLGLVVTYSNLSYFMFFRYGISLDAAKKPKKFHLYIESPWFCSESSPVMGPRSLALLLISILHSQLLELGAQ